MIWNHSVSIFQKIALQTYFLPSARSFTEEFLVQSKNYMTARSSRASSRRSLQPDTLKMLLYRWQSTGEMRARQDSTNVCFVQDIIWTRSPCLGTWERALFLSSDVWTRGMLTQGTLMAFSSVQSAAERSQTTTLSGSTLHINILNMRKNSLNGDTISSCCSRSSLRKTSENLDKWRNM